MIANGSLQNSDMKQIPKSEWVSINIHLLLVDKSSLSAETSLQRKSGREDKSNDAQRTRIQVQNGNKCVDYLPSIHNRVTQSDCAWS